MRADVTPFSAPCSSCSSWCSPADRVIQRKRRDYLDPNSSSNMKKLNDDLQSIHSIMRKTIDDVLDRCVYNAVLVTGSQYGGPVP